LLHFQQKLYQAKRLQHQLADANVPTMYIANGLTFHAAWEMRRIGLIPPVLGDIHMIKFLKWVTLLFF
jgi:hypothetical protein